MSLASLKKIKKSETVEFVADLSAFAEGEPVLLKFRRPGAADYFPPASLRRAVGIAFPALTVGDPQLISYILLLGLCYVPDGDASASEPWRAFAEMGKDSPEALMALIGQFVEAFPAGLVEAKADAKND